MSSECGVIGLVLHFRTPERTLACLRSLADEGICHAVLVDNSEDRGQSIQAMQGGIADLADAGFRVDVLQPPHNLGFAGGVGLGLEYVSRNRHAPVLLINSDATLARGALAAMIDGLHDAAIVVPSARSSHEAPSSSSIVFYQRHLGLYLRRPAAGVLRYPSGCCLLIREDQVRADLFDQDFFFYGEDVMLGFDLAQRGVSMVECRNAAVIHAGSASAKNGSLFYEYHMNRGHWLLAQKLATNRLQKIFYISSRCISLPLRAIVRTIRFRSSLPIKGLGMATWDVFLGRCRSFTPPPN